MPASSAKSRPGPKPKHSTRQSLIDSGVQVMHAIGYGASGVHEILTSAKVPKGSFYHHFDSKENFGVEVINSHSELSLATLKVNLEDTTLPPLERLSADFLDRGRAYEQAGFNQGCMFGNLSLEVADRSDAMRQSLKKHFRQWRDLIEGCISAGQQDGSIRNPAPASRLAEFTLSSWEGALLRARTEKTAEALAVFHEFIFGEVLA